MFSVSPTHLELERDLRTFISQATGFAKSKILQGNRPAPSDITTYLSLQYVTDQPIGFPSIDYIDIDGDVENKTCYINGLRKYTYRLTCTIGDRSDLIPLDYLKRVINYASTPNGRQLLNFTNFLPNTFNQINLADSLDSNAYELRSVLDMTILVAETSCITVPNFSEIELYLTYDYGSLLQELKTITFD